MEELIKTFHIDAKLIIAQLFNFIIVLLVFKKFAYKPILKMLNDRTAKIERGLKEAKEASEKLSEADIKKKEIMQEARIEAQEILSKAEKSANNLKEEIISESKENARKIMGKASASIGQEKERIIFEIKKEVAELVTIGMGKVFEKNQKKADFEEKVADDIIPENLR